MSEPAAKKTLQITVKSTPFIDDPANASEFYAALGRALFLWGRFENCFVNALMIIRNMPEAQHLDAEFPVSWKRRAELWRRAFKDLPRLHQYRDKANALIRDAMEAQRVRVIFFHGDWQEFTSSDPLTAKVIMTTHKKDKVTFATYTASLAQIEDFASECDALNIRLLELFWALSVLGGQPWPQEDPTQPQPVERHRRLFRMLLRMPPNWLPMLMRLTSPRK